MEKTQVRLVFVLVSFLLVINFVSAGNLISIQDFNFNDSYSDPIVSFSQPNEKPSERTECEKTGCFLDDECYQFGYINNGTYCSEKGKHIAGNIYRSAFINQSDVGMNCSQSYECKTGVCSNGFCADLDAMNIEKNSLKNNLTILSQENTELKSNFENLNGSLSETQQLAQENKGILEKIVDFLKNIGLFKI